MSEERRKRPVRTKNVFQDEMSVLKESRLFLDQQDLSLDACKKELTLMQERYDELLDQAKLITKVSDRLQNKINKANDQLESKNDELQESLDALTKAKVGRKAATITIIVVIVLFLFTEAFIEPIIEAQAESYFPLANKDAFLTVPTLLALLAKGLIALSLRPIEKIVEKRLMKQESARLLAEKEIAKNGVLA